MLQMRDYALRRDELQAPAHVPARRFFRWQLLAGQTFTADDAANVLTSEAHTLTNGETVWIFSDDTPPAPLIADPAVLYYVVSATADTFQLSASYGGSPIDLTDAGTGAHEWIRRPQGANAAGNLVQMLQDVAFPETVGAQELTYKVHRYDVREFSVDPATDLFTAIAHGLSNGQTIAIGTTGTVPAPLSPGLDLPAGQSYHVVNRTDDTFQLALSAGGAAIDITTAGSGTLTFGRTKFAQLLRLESDYVPPAGAVLPCVRHDGGWFSLV
ncbi:MAG: hypothetical protein KY476_00630 [Planctomycetes bacterium]|nr:hypothetical protein [Planctomycetota bacterium]